MLGICKGDYALTTELCCRQQLGMSRNEIIRHGRWYSVFCDLMDRKRDAISRWRIEKERKKPKESSELEGTGAEGSSKKQSLFEEKIQREVRRQLIETWKREKAERRQSEIEQERQQEIERKRKAKVFRKRQIQKRKIVVDYKRQKVTSNRMRSENAILECGAYRTRKQTISKRPFKVVVSRPSNKRTGGSTQSSISGPKERTRKKAKDGSTEIR